MVRFRSGLRIRGLYREVYLSSHVRPLALHKFRTKAVPVLRGKLPALPQLGACVRLLASSSHAQLFQRFYHYAGLSSWI